MIDGQAYLITQSNGDFDEAAGAESTGGGDEAAEGGGDEAAERGGDEAAEGGGDEAVEGGGDNLSPVAICRGYCYTKTDAWEQRCAWGGCGGCAECLIPPPSPPPLPPPAGCTVALAVNYDPLAVADDGSCVFGPGPDVEVPVQTSTSESLFVRPRCEITGRTLATGGRCDLLPYPASDCTGFYMISVITGLPMPCSTPSDDAQTTCSRMLRLETRKTARSILKLQTS